MSEISKRDDKKDLEIIAKDKFIDLNYEKRKHVYDIFEEKNMHGKLDNIATLINNKLVETGNFFYNKGIQFYSQSKLKPLIEKRLNTYYEKGCSELENGMVHDSVMDLEPEEYMDLKLVVLYNEMLEKSYEKYKGYCKEVFNFNILTNIIKDIVDDFFESRTAQEAMGKLGMYKKELTTIGYEQLVPVLETSLRQEADNRLEKLGKKKESSINTEQKVKCDNNAKEYNNTKELIEDDCR